MGGIFKDEAGPRDGTPSGPILDRRHPAQRERRSHHTDSVARATNDRGARPPASTGARPARSSSAPYQQDATDLRALGSAAITGLLLYGTPSWQPGVGPRAAGISVS